MAISSSIFWKLQLWYNWLGKDLLQQYYNNLVTDVMDDDVNDAMVKDVNASLKPQT